MAWPIPSGLAVVLALVATSYGPPTGDDVSLALTRVGEAFHRSSYAMQISVDHQSRHEMLVGESCASNDHLCRYVMLIGEELVATSHSSNHSIRINTDAEHHGRYKLLQGGWEINADHGGLWGIAIGMQHNGRHQCLSLEAETAAEHKSIYAVAVGNDHLNIYPVKTVASHLGSWTNMVLEYWSKTDHMARHALLVGEAEVAQNHAANQSIMAGVEHACDHAILFIAQNQHIGNWDVKFPSVGDHLGVYDLLLFEPLAVDHRSAQAIYVGADHVGVWPPLAVAVADHVGSWSPLTVISADHAISYRMTEQAVSGHDGKYELWLLNPVMASHRADFTMHSGDVRIITDQPQLVHHGQSNTLRAAEIRTDEGSFSWLARLDIGSLEDWRAINIGDVISVIIYGETFTLVIDEKTMERDRGGVGVALSVMAVSPLAMRRDRISRSWSGPINARIAVEDLLGPVTWTLPQWEIPPGRLAADRADPINLARQIVGAAGGVIESLPDGSIVCRPMFTHAVPEWATATPDHTITDAETVSVSESFSPVELANRIAISDGSSLSASDEVEYVPDNADRNRGVIRVYPAPWREVSVAHTGDNQVTLSALGHQWREEVEVIQVSGGRGNTRYPVSGIVGSSWQHVNLGGVNFTANSKEVVSAVSGYSLLRLTYLTRCIAWAAADVRDEEVLFLVVDL